MVVGVFIIKTRERLFPNHGYEARTELEARSCDWLQRFWWLYELALRRKKVLDRNVLHGREERIRKEKVKEKIHEPTRFKDNYSNHSLATVPEMFVGIS